MRNLSRSQKMLMGLEALVVGLASCGPLIVEQAADGAPPVDKNPTTLFEDTSNPEVATAQPGEIPLQPSVITGSLVLEPAQAYSDAGPDPEATNTPEPYVPDNYSVYAQARGLDVPSNVNPEVDTQFRAFYNYIFNQQFEITNADGTVTTGSLLSASNPEINIHIAPDGTPYVKGTALDNDPAFGGGDHHFVMIWDISAGTIASLRISKQIGEPFINGYGNYTAQSPDGRTYSYNPVTNNWESDSPAAPTATVAAPTAAPTATVAAPTPAPTATVAAPTPAPTATAEVLTAGTTRYNYQTAEGTQISALVPNEFMSVLDIAQLDVEGDSAFLGNMPLFFRNGATWVVNPGVKQETYYQGSPALVLSTSTHNNTEARSMLNVSEVHSIQDEAWTGGYRMVSVDPAGIEKVVFELVEVRTSSGVSQVERAAVSLVYFNEADALTTAWFHVYDGALSINNTEGRPISDLLEIVDEPVKMFFFANFSNEDDRYELVGVPLADVPSTDVVNQINNGGHISVGWPLTINTSK